MTRFVRVALLVLFLDELVVGAWNAVAPLTFYEHFPTVDLTPPFSEHYARDFGGATLGLALLLGLALVRPRSGLVVPAALAFSLFAVPHFVFHLLHLHGASLGEAVALTAANATVAVLGLAVVVVEGVHVRREHRRMRASQGVPRIDQGRG